MLAKNFSKKIRFILLSFFILICLFSCWGCKPSEQKKNLQQRLSFVPGAIPR